MKRKKGLFAVVAALAVSSVMAAMAYTTANITSPGQITINTTEASLLSFTPYQNLGNKDLTAYVDNGVLKFRVGYSNQLQKWAGLQPNSAYYWNPIVKITNNSKDNIVLRCNNGVSGVPSNVKFQLRTHAADNSFVDLVLNNEGWSKDWHREVYIPAGGSVDLEMDVVVSEGAAYTLTSDLTFTFDATAAN